MSQFFKLNKKNAVSEQTQHPSINPSGDKGDQHAAPSLEHVGIYRERAIQKATMGSVQTNPSSC